MGGRGCGVECEVIKNPCWDADNSGILNEDSEAILINDGPQRII